MDDVAIQTSLSNFACRMHLPPSTFNYVEKELLKKTAGTISKNESVADHSRSIKIVMRKFCSLPIISSKIYEIMGNEGFDHLLLLAEWHDIGKIAVPREILSKPGPLNDNETAFVKLHAPIGCLIATQMPTLSPISEYIKYHHEWYGGRGYFGLKAEDIHLADRIMAIVDAFDAMTCEDRPYRKAISVREAAAELIRCSPIQFDPLLARIFVSEVLGHIS